MLFAATSCFSVLNSTSFERQHSMKGKENERYKKVHIQDTCDFLVNPYGYIPCPNVCVCGMD